MSINLANNAKRIPSIIIDYCDSYESGKRTKSDAQKNPKELQRFLSSLFHSRIYTHSRSFRFYHEQAPASLLVAPPMRLDLHLTPGKENGLENRRYWVPHNERGSTLTDPNEFDSRSFQFIVHVIGANAPNFRETLKNPELVFRTRLLSCSLINQEKHKTFILDCGLILKVPPQNIYATTPCDMELQNKVVDKDNAEAHLRKKNKHEYLDAELSRVNRKFGIRTPEDILACSHPTKINEVAVLGETAHGQVEVIGIFRKVLHAQKGKSYPGTDKRICPLLKSLAEARGLPEVEIPVCYDRKKEEKATTSGRKKLGGKEETPMTASRKKLQRKEKNPMKTGKKKLQHKEEHLIPTGKKSSGTKKLQS